MIDKTNLFLKYLSRNSIWIVFSTILIFYTIYYARLGFENYDNGFVLGVSHQVAMGDRLYGEIEYVRPPISPIIHSINYIWPLNYAPVYFDRVMFFLQIALFSILSSLIFQKYSACSNRIVAYLSTIGFIYSAHAFPPMGWYTVDGITFSVISFFLITRNINESKLTLFVAAFVSVLAALSKQPFYATPILILMYLVLSKGLKQSVQFILYLFVSLVILAILLIPYVKHSNIINSINSQTSIADLIGSGFNNYIYSWNQNIIYFSIIIVFTVLLVYFRNKSSSISFILYNVYILIFITALYNYYFHINNYSQPLGLFNCIYSVILFCSIFLYFQSKKEIWLVLVLLQAIAWEASISWGYSSPVLFSCPSILALFYIFYEKNPFTRLHEYHINALIIISLTLFYIGSRYSYSLEGTVFRRSNLVDMGKINGIFRNVYSTQDQYNCYTELKELSNEYKESVSIVLPNFPIYQTLLNKKNPIGIDLPLNCEISDFTMVLKKMNSQVGYVFISKAAQKNTKSEGKFGSKLMLKVLENWIYVGERRYFSIYKNPYIKTN